MTNWIKFGKDDRKMEVVRWPLLEAAGRDRRPGGVVGGGAGLSVGLWMGFRHPHHLVAARKLRQGMVAIAGIGIEFLESLRPGGLRAVGVTSISLPNMLEASAVSDDPVTNLQLALGVELAVMPPYLYALWSIKPAAEGAGPAAREAARTIRAVVYEEMLHAALVGNILNALGQAPLVTSHLMTYPGPLPGHIKTGPYAFNVFLGLFSAETVDMFRKIENPHWANPGAAADGWTTLRELYDRVIAELRQQSPPFSGGRQVAAADSPGPGRLLPVTSLQSAIDAIAIILDQGEGLQPKKDKPSNYEEDPSNYKEDKDHEVAHYYQFRTIQKYFSSGLVVASRDVYPVMKNPDPERYSPAQRAANHRFNQVYTALVDSLQEMFTSSSPTPFGSTPFGRPTKLMGRLGHLTAVLRSLGPVPGTTDLAGPSFQYLDGDAR